MTQPQIRIAFSGLGDHAIRAHLKHLVQSGRCRVVGAFDPGRQIDAEWRQRHGLDASFKQYRDFDALTSDPGVDAVLIASPDRFHLPQLRATIQAGKHAFCEKPLCTGRDELRTLRSLLQEAAGKGLSISSCHPRRFDPPYVWLKENLPRLTGQYGRVLQISLDFSYHEPSPDKGHLHGGSLLLDHANHEVDYVNLLLGRAGANLTRLLDSPDRYALCGVRDDGVTLHFHGTRRLSQRIYPESVHVRFERGELDLNTYDARLSRLVDHDAIAHQTGAVAAPDKSLQRIDHAVTDYEKRFRGVNNDWLDGMTNGRQCYLATEDMLYNAAVSAGFGEGSQGTLQVAKEGLEPPAALP
jgi:predicted dehydrogenase